MDRLVFRNRGSRLRDQRIRIRCGDSDRDLFRLAQAPKRKEGQPATKPPGSFYFLGDDHKRATDCK